MGKKKYFDIMTPMWGRLVGGSTTKPQTEDYEGKPLVYKSGDNIGQPRKSYFLPVAINKNDEGLSKVLETVLEAAKDGFPEYVDGFDLNLDFSWKITDGDSTKPNKKKRRPCDNEGYPGHYVFNFSSDTPPKCYHKGRVCDPDQIKPGDYVRIAGSVCKNDSEGNPGIYMNHDAIELVRHGEEIQFRPDASELFASAGGDPNVVPAWVQPATGTAQPSKQPATATPPMPPKPAAPPMPPAPPKAQQQHVPDIRYICNGVQYRREDLVGWKDEQIATLPTVDLNDIPF